VVSLHQGEVVEMISNNFHRGHILRIASGIITLAILLLAGSASAATLNSNSYPIADSYVNSATPDTNYGSSLFLIAGTETFGSSTKIIYLKFNISSIPINAEILNATLNLQYAYGPSCGNAETISAYYVANNSWDENAITYNNQPSLATTPEDTLSVTQGPPEWFSWRVIEAIKNRKEQGLISIALKGEGPGQCDKPFNSRESESPPFLAIDYQTPVPTGGSVSGYKINDTNSNRRWDAGEKVISNWTIRLIGITRTGKDTKVIRKETFTDAMGFYKFENLPAGRYFVIEKLKKGFVPTSSPVKRINLVQEENSENNNFTNKPVHSLTRIGSKIDQDDYEVINRNIEKYIEDMD
jgi:hypothetical protein